MKETCDKKTKHGRCNSSAHMEVYWKSDGTRHWSYLCRFHYYIDRIKNYIFRWRNWYCEMDIIDEMVNNDVPVKIGDEYIETDPDLKRVI